MNGTDDNITAFPLFNLYNIPEALRKVANDIEQNPDLCVRIVLCGERADDNTVWYKAFGPKDFIKSQAVSIVEYGKAEIMGLFR